MTPSAPPCPQVWTRSCSRTNTGEVCDGTITTVFFDRGKGLRTPPLTCGLLPGVLRADLAVPEEVLLAAICPMSACGSAIRCAA